MKNRLILLLWLAAVPLFSQSEKGITPARATLVGATTASTYAVVVGISDYQDPGIPDLRFADKDALAFAGFLQSQSGGALDQDHLKVLINEKATQAQFGAALDWLWEVAGENDKVIIYFSGHGDVERKSITQPGYLLCWDAPPNVYMGGGAFNVRDLNDVVSTISIQNRAKVMLVTDACRAGKLSGSGIGGAQATAANLAKQYGNEIKILSCQPDEYSIEGEQWGGGRGAFSYHLLDGLYGMADGNADNTVNLKELGRYLEDRVSAEVAPQNQNPMTIGGVNEKLTDVFPEILAELKAGRKGKMQIFSSTESRGIEENVLEAADSNIVEMYLAFQKSLEEKAFLFPENACADFYYEKLSREPALERLHSSMRRNYAAALQEDAQQVLNRLLNSQPIEVNKTNYAKNSNYGIFPSILRRAAELLGAEHYMYRCLLARSYWFEGYINDHSSWGTVNKKNAREVLQFYKKALEYQPEMPHAWNQMAIVYGMQLHKKDSMEYYLSLALDAVPQWVTACYWGGFSYNSLYFTFGENADYENARKWLEKGLAIDSNSVLLLSELGDLYVSRGLFKKAENNFKRSLNLESTAQTLEYLGWCYFAWGKFEAAEQTWQKAIALDSTYITKLSNYLLALDASTGEEQKVADFLEAYLKNYKLTSDMLLDLGQAFFQFFPERALPVFLKSLELEETNVNALNYAALCHTFMADGNYEESMRLTQRAYILEPDNPLTALNIGLLSVRSNNFDVAEKYSRQALSIDSNYVSANAALFMLYFQNGLIEKAEEQIRIGMEHNAKWFLNTMGYCARRYLLDPNTTPRYFKKIEELYPENPLVNAAFALDLTLLKKDKDSAFAELEKSIQKGLSDRNILINIKLSVLKMDTLRWNTLVKNNFPELIIE